MRYIKQIAGIVLALSISAIQVARAGSESNGESAGIGVRTEVHEGAIVVTSLVIGSPAQRAGVQRGDRIIEVEDRALSRGLTDDELGKLLSGPAGSYVHVTILRSGESAPRHFLIQRGSLLSPTYESPTYDHRYEDGVVVQVGKYKNLEVRLSAEMSDDLALVLYVVNDTDQPVTFYPEQVRVEAIRRKKDVVTHEPVRMFPAAEYVSRLNTSIAWKSLLAGMGNYQEPQPQTYTSSSQTHASAYDWSSGTTVSGSSTSSGTVTKQVTDADRQAAQDRARAKTQAEMAPQEGRARAIAAGLMRTQTLDPHMGYGGTVFAKSKGKEYIATVPFGGNEFQFSFTFK